MNRWDLLQQIRDSEQKTRELEEDFRLLTLKSGYTNEKETEKWGEEMTRLRCLTGS